MPQGTPRAVRFASPWAGTNTLGSISLDVFTEDYAPLTRAQAMRVPAVAKARAIICGTLAHQPLRVYQGEEAVADLPQWVQGTDTDMPLWHRMAWTLDDLFFFGWSLWVKQYDGSEIVAAMRVPFDLWQFDVNGNIEVCINNEWISAPAGETILFAGPQEGILDLAADTIRGARAVEQTVRARALTPFAEIEIKQKAGGAELKPEEIDELLDDYLSSRRNIDQGVLGFTPDGYDVLYHGEAKADVLIEARNAYRLDIAAFANLPGQIIDASLSTASLTYSTQDGARNELIDYSLNFWADPIASRLSQDDVVPPGQRVRFDITEFVALVNTPNSPVTED